MRRVSMTVVFLIAVLVFLVSALRRPAAPAPVRPTSLTEPTPALAMAAPAPATPSTTSCASALPPRPSTTLELYGTIHSMGVIVSIGATDDPDRNATASVEYRTGGKPYRVGFPLSRVSNTRFVGSLFWLDPGALLRCAYDHIGRRRGAQLRHFGRQGLDSR